MKKPIEETLGEFLPRRERVTMRVPPFLQIAVGHCLSDVVQVQDQNGVIHVVSVPGTVLYGLDPVGTVWRKMPYNLKHEKPTKWEKVNDEVAIPGETVSDVPGEGEPASGSRIPNSNAEGATLP